MIKKISLIGLSFVFLLSLNSTVFAAPNTLDKIIEAAKKEINNIVVEPEKGQRYTGTVKRVMNYGLFVEFLPGKEGLVHVSKIGPGFIKNLEEKFNVGDEVDVIIDEIDQKGRVNLSKA